MAIGTVILLPANVLITLTVFWLDAAGTLHEVAKCLTMKLAVYLAKEVAAILRTVLIHKTKKLYNDSRRTCFAPITGYNRFTRNYCTHRSDTMLPGKEKENEPAVAWRGLQRIRNHPNSGSHRLLARASVTGLEVLVMRIPYRSGFRPTGPQRCCNSCNRRRIVIVQRTRLGWTRKWPSGHSQAMAAGTGKPTYAVQGWQLS